MTVWYHIPPPEKGRMYGNVAPARTETIGSASVRGPKQLVVKP